MPKGRRQVDPVSQIRPNEWPTAAHVPPVVRFSDLGPRVLRFVKVAVLSSAVRDATTMGLDLQTWIYNDGIRVTKQHHRLTAFLHIPALKFRYAFFE
jgi:hypothetical protein